MHCHPYYSYSRTLLFHVPPGVPVGSASAVVPAAHGKCTRNVADTGPCGYGYHQRGANSIACSIRYRSSACGYSRHYARRPHRHAAGTRCCALCVCLARVLMGSNGVYICALLVLLVCLSHSLYIYMLLTYYKVQKQISLHLCSFICLFRK